MQNIFEKFHTYDIVAYLIPGIFTVCYVCYGMHLIDLIPLDSKNNLITDSVAFFIILYYIGIVIHEISYRMQKLELHRLWKKPYSKMLLHKDCDILNMVDKRKGWDILKEDFGIKIDLRTKNLVELNEKIDNYSQILYERCRECLKYEYKNFRKLDQEEIFNIHYGLARNLLASTLIAIVFFAVIAIYIHINQLPFFTLSVILMLISYIFAKLLYQRAQKYAIYHVRHVIILYLSIFGDTPFSKN